MKLNELLALKAEGKFHHATWRGHGLMEGLWVYKTSDLGPRGFEPAGFVGKDDPEIKEIMGHINGLHVGCYGGG